MLPALQSLDSIDHHDASQDMKSQENYTVQLLCGWMYQVIPGHYGYYLEVWNPQGKEYRNPKAFEQYNDAVAFAESLIALADQESNKVATQDEEVCLDCMMRQLVRIECDDCIYLEWHIKCYEDSDNDWDVYAIAPFTGKAEISLKRQADLQNAIAQVKVQIDVIEAMRHPSSLNHHDFDGSISSAC